MLPITALARNTFWSKRHLFRLPDLTSFSSSLTSTIQPQTYHEQKILPYSRKQLYAVVSDVGAYASFVPFCTHSHVLRTLVEPNVKGEEMEAELTVAFLAFTERYTSRVTCIPFESVRAVAVSSTPLFKTLETTWKFQPVSLPSTSTSTSTSRSDDAVVIDTSSPQPSLVNTSVVVGPTTLLSLDLSFAFSNPLHAAVSGTFFGKVSKLMVKAFEERCLKVYGPPGI
ncbi:dehydrase and lipid transport-domain-containing protein [Multifurca ochricompacta]|uniref:Dehydrase and lipid transport-domain-containing protein n=1 Tax=Multifurca ochricompacta TaxID=376703 RepID=A0AAD4M2X1_9AGAM|nr:dehydrase and lipid transport-domain-containing protein [Multifurca ochricompacta]